MPLWDIVAWSLHAIFMSILYVYIPVLFSIFHDSGMSFMIVFVAIHTLAWKTDGHQSKAQTIAALASKAHTTIAAICSYSIVLSALRKAVVRLCGLELTPGEPL